MSASDNSLCATRVPCEVVEVFSETVGAWLPVQVAESSKAFVVVVVVVVVAMGAMGLATAIAWRRRAHYPTGKDDRRIAEKEALLSDTRNLRPVLPPDAKWEYEATVACVAHWWRDMGDETSRKLTDAWNQRSGQEFHDRALFANNALCVWSFQAMDLRFSPGDRRTPIRIVFQEAVIDRAYMKRQLEERRRCEWPRERLPVTLYLPVEVDRRSTFETFENQIHEMTGIPVGENRLPGLVSDNIYDIVEGLKEGETIKLELKREAPKEFGITWPRHMLGRSEAPPGLKRLRRGTLVVRIRLDLIVEVPWGSTLEAVKAQVCGMIPGLAVDNFCETIDIPRKTIVLTVKRDLPTEFIYRWDQHMVESLGDAIEDFKKKGTTTTTHVERRLA